MPVQHLDRRVGRTRRRLKEALGELIQEREYDEITIQDIARRADVGRSTFYSHFASKEDLLFSGFDEWLLSLAESARTGHVAKSDQDESAQSYRFSLPLLKHIRSHKRFFQAMIVSGSDVRIRRKSTALLAELVGLEMARTAQSAMATFGTDAELVRQGRAHCVVGAFLGLVSWWLDAGDRLSAEGVDRVFQESVVRAKPARAATGTGAVSPQLSDHSHT
ncbi:MAG: TetR/AcrR family transcriptional regulator [Terriglobia bacterium]